MMADYWYWDTREEGETSRKRGSDDVEGSPSTSHDNMERSGGPPCKRIRSTLRNAASAAEKPQATPLTGYGLTGTLHDRKEEITKYIQAKFVPKDLSKSAIEDTTCFGALSFYGFKSGKRADVPYLRLPTDAKCKDVWELLCDVWQVPQPKMVVSLVGGDIDNLSEPMKGKLKRALIKVVTKTDAWIITPGMGRVAQFVGQAVRDYHIKTRGNDSQQITILGVANWGILDNKKALTSDWEGNFDAKYLKLQLTKQNNTMPLDSNHTHFLLVDDGTHYKTGTEKKFRAALEGYISKQVIPTTGVRVPIEVLVLGGTAAETIQLVCQAAKNEIHFTLNESHDGIANLIYACMGDGGPDSGHLERTRLGDTWADEDEDNDIVKSFRLSDDIREMDVGRLNEEIDSVSTLEKALISDLLEANNRIILSLVLRMFEENRVSEFDEATVVNAFNTVQIEYQMNVALAWDRCDVARKLILHAGNRMYLKDVGFNQQLLTALLQRKTKFVEMLIKHTVWSRQNDQPVSKITDEQLIKELYDKSGRILCYRNMEEQQKQTEKKGLKRVAGVIKPFVDAKLFKDYCHGLKKKVIILQRELFFWAVLVNRKELVKIFWEVGKDHIGGALVASSLYRSLSKQAKSNEELDLAEELEKQSKAWEQVAVGLLQECYKSNPEDSRDLLRRVIPYWGNTTLFALAEAGVHMDFMKHECCQTKLNDIWKGKRALHTIPLKRLLPAYGDELEEDVSSISSSNKSDHDNDTEHKVQARKGEGEDQKVSTAPKKAQNCSPCSSICGSICSICKAPVRKFALSLLSHLIMIVLLSYFTLVDLAPVTPTQQPSYIEYAVFTWAFTFFIEEIRQIGSQDRETLKSKVALYFKDNWNCFDSVIFISLVISAVLHHVLHRDDFVWARTMYSFTVAMHYLRLLQFFLVGKDLGPKVIMIHLMLTDLKVFMAILATVMLAYGVAVQSLLFPNSTLSISLLGDILYKPYWHIYGELFLDQLEGDVDGCSNDEAIWRNATLGIPQCPERNVAVILLLVVYMMITSILLVNLLIAMLGYTFNKVQERSEKLWSYHIYSLVYEYCHKPRLPPPLNIIPLLYCVLVRPCIRVCQPRQQGEGCCTRGFTSEEDEEFRKRFGYEEMEKLTALEKRGLENYRKRNQQQTDSGLRQRQQDLPSDSESEEDSESEGEEPGRWLDSDSDDDINPLELFDLFNRLRLVTAFSDNLEEGASSSSNRSSRSSTSDHDNDTEHNPEEEQPVVSSIAGHHTGPAPPVGS